MPSTDICPQRLLVMDDVCVDFSVSLREAMSNESASRGQGLIKLTAVVPSVATQITRSVSRQN